MGMKRLVLVPILMAAAMVAIPWLRGPAAFAGFLTPFLYLLFGVGGLTLLRRIFSIRGEPAESLVMLATHACGAFLAYLGMAYYTGADRYDGPLGFLRSETVGLLWLTGFSTLIVAVGLVLAAPVALLIRYVGRRLGARAAREQGDA